MKLRLTLEVTLRPDVTTGEWSALLGAALETLRPALAKGSVPMVTTTKAPAVKGGRYNDCNACDVRHRRGLPGMCPGCAAERTRAELSKERALPKARPREVTLRDVLHAELDASDLAARNKLSALSEIARGTETGDAIVEALTGELVLSTREQAEAARKAAALVTQTSGAPSATPVGHVPISSPLRDPDESGTSICDPPHGASLCRCSHAFDRHDRIGGSEQRRGACAAYGCRCGLFRAADRVANANGGSR